MPKCDYKYSLLYKVKDQKKEEKMLSEAESNAVQDLLGLEIEMMENQELGTTDKCVLMRNHILKVKEKLKTLPVIEFPSNCEWFNTSQPWTSDHLKGRLTLLDFWTYCCVNCMHILPDLEALEVTFKDDEQVLVIGVHSAKFENERVGSNISNVLQMFVLFFGLRLLSLGGLAPIRSQDSRE